MSLKKLVSFNEDNIDAYEIIKNMTTYSEFVCDAIRFYKNYLDNVKEDKTCVLERSSNLDNRIKHLEVVLSEKLNHIEQLIGEISTYENVKPTDEAVHEYIDPELQRLIQLEDD